MALRADGLSLWEPESEGPGLREITLAQLLDEQAATFADRPALVFDEFSVRWTYADLKARADRLARGLHAWDVGFGDRVAVLSPNCPEWVLIEYALARLGAVMVTVNPGYHERELAYLLDQGDVTALITVDGYRGFDIAAALTDLMPDLAGRGTATGQREDATRFPALRRIGTFAGSGMAGAIPLDGITALSERCDETAFEANCAKVSAGDIAQIQYTSGTTGSPKGAMLRHRGIVNNARLMATRAGFTEEDVMVSAMPFFHTAGCVCNVIGMHSVGGCLVGMSAFDAARMLELIGAHRGTIINAVPTMLVRMLEEPTLTEGRVDVSSLRIAFTGGTTIQPELMREVRDRMGGEPMIIMGMTECSPIITQTSPDDPYELRLSTAGVPLPHTGIRVVDPETGETVPVGEPGELMIRGYLVTAGYYDMPDKTAESLGPDGWFHSGDLAVLSETGHLRIVGRIKDMIIRGGENIYPAEIEAFLVTLPDVSDAQVVGVPDRDMGEEICAVIVAKPGKAISTDAIQAACRAELARHKMPKYILTATSYPMTANGKVQKFELRKIAMAELGLTE
ncbi:AMP-binding protein [Rhodobacterales bacterium HKCCE2091]|nr:AMP-binding protein [Rhodobacterales bacterium HKCCE2091]